YEVPARGALQMKNNFNSATSKGLSINPKEGVGNYVADMQLHMALQSKNLLPTPNHKDSAVSDLMREAQEVAEKLASRQRS
ncbi:MAG: hypothetical protein AAF889_14775, partial [Cyanobacteria bacterium P01_D01_bin.73]